MSKAIRICSGFSRSEKRYLRGEGGGWRQGMNIGQPRIYWNEPNGGLSKLSVSEKILEIRWQ